MKERLEADLKQAMKSGNGELVQTLRFLLAQIQTEEINSRGKGGSGTLSDEAVLAVLKSEVKKRNESIEVFRQGNREDLASQEEKSVALIKVYLPPELGRDQVLATVRKLHEAGTSDFNTLMKQTMAELKGQADGKLVSEVVREVING